MRALLDINVLISLLDADHPLHHAAVAWFKQNVSLGWASCPLTQNGCIRVMSQPGYPNAVPVTVVRERLKEATSHDSHRFCPDGINLLDEGRVGISRVHGPRQITDVYLLALATAHGDRFVTFDEAIPVSSARDATEVDLPVLGSV